MAQVVDLVLSRGPVLRVRADAITSVVGEETYSIITVTGADGSFTVNANEAEIVEIMENA